MLAPNGGGESDSSSWQATLVHTRSRGLRSFPGRTGGRLDASLRLVYADSLQPWGYTFYETVSSTSTVSVALGAYEEPLEKKVIKRNF